jgi:hypothetical protein
MLLELGHAVAGLTRSQPDVVRALGAEPIVCDVFDLERLRSLVGAFAPDVVVDLLTDLPDELDRLAEFAERNNRIRTEGTRNLLAAAPGARFIAESVAFELAPASAAALAELERLVPESIRLERLCGPGTYDPDCTGEGSRIHVDDAARLFADAVGS